MRELKNEYVDQLFDEGLNALYTKFHKYTPDNELRKIFENGYEIIREHKTDKCLMNLEQIPAHEIENTEYVDRIWLPTVEKEGILVVAIVLPDLVFGKLSSKDVQIIDDVVIHKFNDESKARKWIKEISFASIALISTTL